MNGLNVSEQSDILCETLLVIYQLDKGVTYTWLALSRIFYVLLINDSSCNNRSVTCVNISNTKCPEIIICQNQTEWSSIFQSILQFGPYFLVDLVATASHDVSESEPSHREVLICRVGWRGWVCRLQVIFRVLPMEKNYD